VSAEVVGALQDLDQLARANWAGETTISPLGEHPRRSILHRIEGLLQVLAALQVSLAFVSVLFLQPDTRNVPTLLLLAVALAFMGGAVGLVRTAPSDARARHLSLLFACIASATSILLQPRPGELLGSIGALTVVVLPETLLPYYLWSFVALFPRASRYGPFGLVIRRVRRASLAGGLFLLVVNALHRSGLVGDALANSNVLAHLLRQSTSAYWLAIFVVALPAPFVAMLRAREVIPSERRRTLLFLVGLCIGVLPLFLGVLAEVMIPSVHEYMSQPTARRIGSVIVYGSLLTIPISASVAVSASFFRVQPMLRHATRFALARSTLTVLSGSAWLALLVFLWIHRLKSLVWLVTSPTAVLLTGFAALGPFLLRWRPQLLAWFAGNSRNLSPGRSLSEFARSIHAARDLRELEQLLAFHARDLLEAPNARMLLLDEVASVFCPVSEGCRSLKDDSLISTLARNPDGLLILDVSAPSSIVRWLPEEERQWVADSEVGLLAPLADALGKVKGLLLLERRSDFEPYDQEDQRVVQALASTALLGITHLQSSRRFDHGEMVAEVDVAAGECRRCSAVVDSTVTKCDCGGKIEPAVVPRLLRGKFRVDRLLGAGGMGRVYLALDQDLHRQVALKTLPRLRTNSLVRLQREAQSMASFVHPNLAMIFGLETWRGVPILVVEYLSGGTLENFGPGRLSPTAVIELGVKLAGGLQAMHEKGLLHRDVKPSNIGFDGAGEPKLLDFGLAGLMDHAGIVQPAESQAQRQAPSSADMLTATNQLVGTPLYLSPEVLRGKRFSVAEDLWSLHLVLWEALVGHHPLAHLDPEAATRQLRSGKIPSIASVRPACPAGLAQLVDDGLSVPGRRPDSAAEMRRRLLAVLH
jgi:hypothetical protein